VSLTYERFIASKKGALHGPLELNCGPTVAEFDAEQNTVRGWHYVYGLHDPRTGELRYIGKSDNPCGRLAQHMQEARGTHRCNWVQSLRKIGLKPVLTIIDATPPGSDWPWMERVYIAAARSAGAPLTNGTDGGEGVAGLSDETRERLRRVHLGRKASPETRARMSAAKKGRRQPQEWIDLMRSICAGRPLNRACAEANRARMQKLTADQVREIRRRVKAGERRVLLAREFSVTVGTISNVVIRRTYGHILDGDQ
jgi:hypothetical protein